jgi:hypothetical protein
MRKKVINVDGIYVDLIDFVGHGFSLREGYELDYSSSE